MDTKPIEFLVSETSNRLKRARVIKSDLKAGFPQLKISSSSSKQSDLIKTFSSPLPGVREVDCHNCARYKVRLAELQAKLIELEQERANDQQETQLSNSQLTK